MLNSFTAHVQINNTPYKVWEMLTKPQIMTQWLGDPDMNLTVLTNWQVNSSVIIRGFHHTKFENRGVVLVFEKEKKLSFTHLSSVSGLPDVPESYSTLTFMLAPEENKTNLTLNIDNFPTESIRKHLEFYWRTTLITIKNKAEE